MGLTSIACVAECQPLLLSLCTSCSYLTTDKMRFCTGGDSSYLSLVPTGPVSLLPRATTHTSTGERSQLKQQGLRQGQRPASICPAMHFCGQTSKLAPQMIDVCIYPVTGG